MSAGSIDKTLRERFETAWFEGNPEPIERFLPAQHDPSYLTTLETLVRVDLDCGWKSWFRKRQEAATVFVEETEIEPPRVEGYLERFDRLSGRDVVLRLIQYECSVRRKYGDDVSLEEYRRRFPEVAITGEQLEFEISTVDGYEDDLESVETLPPGEAGDLKSAETLPPESAGDAHGVETLPPDRVDEPHLAETLAPGEVGSGHGEEVRPRSFGNYELLGELGRGGMGIVYRARQRTADRVVALKVIRRDRLEALPRDTQANAVDRFWHEAQAAARLEHDNIVTVYEVGEVDGQPFFSMRYVEGESLSEILRDGPIENRKAAGYMEPVARGVHEAHTLGILHRDLKPQNVMVDSKTGRPLVADFGLAKLAEGGDELTQAGEVMGTPSYMSPEQAKDSGTVTAAADVYALGATFYHILTGRPPFHAATPVETLRQVIDEQPVPPRQLNPSIDRDLETICLKCLEKEPSRRYGTSELLADDLGRYLKGEPILARPIGRLERTWRWCRRNPVIAGLIVSTFTFLVLALVGTTIGLVVASVARREAEVSFRQARGAVDNFYTRVSEDTLLNQPGMQRLRKDLLSDALEYYQQFLQQRGDDPSIQDELAVTHYREGRITELISSPAGALASYQKARQVQEQLLSEQPNDPSRLEALGNSLNAIGTAQQRQGKLDAAREAFQQAIEIRTRLIRAAPDEPEFKRTLANTYMNIGLLEKDVFLNDAATDHYEPAHGHLEKAQRLRLEILRQGGDLPKVQRDVGKGYYGLAALEYAAGDSANAGKNFDKAIRVTEELLRREPNDLANQHFLAVCCRGQADTILSDPNSTEADLDSARRLYEKAAGLTQTLALANPDVARYQAELAGLHMNRGVLERALQRLSAAMDSFGRARDILSTLVEKYPNVPRYQEDLAYLQINLGELQYAQQGPRAAIPAFADAYRTLETLVRGHPGVPEYRRDFVEMILQIARLQAEAGDRQTARANLEALEEHLCQLVKRFAHVDEFNALLEDTRSLLAEVRSERPEQQE